MTKPNLEDEILDEGVDEWLYSLYKPAPYPLERRDFKLRKNDKPKDKISFKQLKDRVGESNALRLYDTLEDAVIEIEELKNELVIDFRQKDQIILDGK